MDVSLFDKCISYISRNYQVRLLEELVISPEVNTGKEFATILFDDGYKDNLIYAAPILEKYKCRASFYIVTDCIEYNVPTWTHILEHSFQYTIITDINLTFDFLPAELQVTVLPTEASRVDYLRKLIPFLKTLTHDQRSRVITRVRDSFYDVGLPRIMMDWRDLLHLAQAGHYIGSHTVSHAMLGTMIDEDQVRAELRNSGAAIEKNLGYFPKTISYPVGSYNDTTIRISKEVGYEIGLAVKQKPYDPSKDPVFEIPRIELYNEKWYKTLLRIHNVIEPLKSLIRY
jgi:peptidoglycan/xylan/chitin deacetylase (PgdA/CDA1 family)